MRRNQRGEINFGCILWAIALLVVIIFLWTFVPVKVSIAKLEDYTDEVATGSLRLAEDKIRSRVLRRARELDLPLKSTKLKVDKRRDRVRIEYSFTVVLEFPGYSYPLDVDYTVERDFMY